jgi:uroporphyrin-III C-methyltransferase/precorrin-2 dehydrogenase/sirohydrochlorin ferrochelatase
MAVGNLSSIAAHLLDNGRPPATSVACVQHAATPQHQVIRCTLADLAASEADLQVENPAVIIIGPTVPVLPAGDGDGRPSAPRKVHS